MPSKNCSAAVGGGNFVGQVVNHGDHRIFIKKKLIPGICSLGLNISLFRTITTFYVTDIIICRIFLTFSMNVENV